MTESGETESLFTLDGRVAVVTGGASGIGAGIAAVLADAGATVVIADRDVAGAEREAAALTEAGRKAAAVRLELADEDSVVDTCCPDRLRVRGAVGSGQQRRSARP